VPTLVLLRHGQSQWNLEDRFTGWVDVDLTPQGEAEARKGGELIAAEGLALNRCYTSVLTGLNQTETAAKHGADQVKVWRRSYDVPPPPLAPGGEFDLSNDRRYPRGAVPPTESLKTTLERVQPYWAGEIAPKLAAGETLLIAAHGNSLRAIVKLLFNVSDADIPAVEIPTGNPLLIALTGQLKPTAARYLDAARAQPLPALG